MECACCNCFWRTKSTKKSQQNIESKFLNGAARDSQWMMSQPDIVDVLTNVSPFGVPLATAATQTLTHTQHIFKAIKTTRHCRSKASQPVNSAVNFTRAQFDYAPSILTDKNGVGRDSNYHKYNQNKSICFPC